VENSRNTNKTGGYSNCKSTTAVLHAPLRTLRTWT
jgi:hypothetical protein